MAHDLARASEASLSSIVDGWPVGYFITVSGVELEQEGSLKSDALVSALSVFISMSIDIGIVPSVAIDSDVFSNISIFGLSSMLSSNSWGVSLEILLKSADVLLGSVAAVSGASIVICSRNDCHNGFHKIKSRNTHIFLKYSFSEAGISRLSFCSILKGLL